MFGKDDLRSCDVVVRRDGCLGIVVKSGNELVIVYQTGGFDTLDEFDDDLLNATHFEDEIQFDIMVVYRSPGIGNGFELYYEEEQVFCRDETWEDPNIPILEEKHRKERERYDAQRAAKYAAMPKVEKPEQNVIHVMVQAFYGNCVITMVDTKDADRLIHGNPTFMYEKVDRKTVRVPDHENLVILYDAGEEERLRERFAKLMKERRTESGGPKPLCVIPEYSLELYSRPLACRMDESGKLLSIEQEDIEIICRYFVE